MTSELFESREDDFLQICSNVRLELAERMPRCSGESQKQLCRNLDRSLEEALILIQEMESELRKAPPTFRTSMITKVRQYKQDVEDLSRQVKKTSSEPYRDDRLRPNFGSSNYNDGNDDLESFQRAQLMQGTASLYRGSDSLARSHQTAAQTEQIGTEIIGELDSQRESLTRTRDRLHETDSNLTKSRKILNSMMRRIISNKFLLVVIILLELVILGVVIWWRFFKHK